MFFKKDKAREIVVVGSILVFALLLRLVNLNQSLWLDEAVQAITSQGSLNNLFLELRGDFHPPLYHFLMWVWVRLFGSSEISLRLPSVLFGVGTVLLVYKIGKFIFQTNANTLGVNRLTPLRCYLAALLMAVAPYHIYYSQEARMYSMSTFFASLSMYFFMKLVIRQPVSPARLDSSERPGAPVSPIGGCRLGYFFATLALLYTDYYGFLILLTQNLIILIRHKFCSDVSIQYKVWWGRQILLLIFFLPWIPMFWVQFKTGQAAILSLPEWGRLVNASFLKVLPLTFIKFIMGRITIFNKKLYALIAGILLFIYGGIIAKGLFQKKKLRFTVDDLRFTVLFWLFLPVIFTWLISLFIPNYQPFRLLLVLPAFYLLLAITIAKTKNSIYRYIKLLLVLLVSLVSLGVYYFNPYFHREDWRGLVEYIESRGRVMAFLPSETSSWPWQYYSLGKAELRSVSSGVKLVGQQDLNHLSIQLSEYPIVYYIRYLVPLFDPEEGILEWLREGGFVKIKEISFNQIPVWEYKKL